MVLIGIFPSGQHVCTAVLKSSQKVGALSEATEHCGLSRKVNKGLLFTADALTTKNSADVKINACRFISSSLRR